MTKKHIIYIGFYIVCAISLLFLYSICRSELPVHFQSPAVSGIVVDSQTGLPLAGVTVKVRWSAMRSTENMHDPESSNIRYAVTVTDTNGVFNVPAWGPVTVSGGWFYFLTDPEAELSKTGREFELIHNKNHEGFEEITPWPLQTVTYEEPSWNGQKIPM